MSDLFDVDGANLDPGFVNLKAARHPIEQEMRATLADMWEGYEPYADPNFRRGFAQDVEGRFWEMYLGCTMLRAGRTLLPAGERSRRGGQPDLCVVEDGRRIWIEAVAPDLGMAGPDQIVPPVPINQGGRAVVAPIRQAQVRVSGAFWTKTRRIARYIEQGVIAPEDTCIIAICGSRFGAYVSDSPLPLILGVLFPIGDAYVVTDRDSGAVTEEGYRDAPFIRRDGSPIPRSAFINERFSDISGVIWSRVGLGNLSRDIRPITYVHNPMARVPLPPRWGVWDREFVATNVGDGWEVNDVLASTQAAETS